MNVWEQERRHFPLLNGDSIYLDHSTSGMVADYSYEAMEKVLRRRVYQGMNIEDYYEHWKFVDHLRGRIGLMFNCDARQVVYGMSSTHLMNIPANGIGLKSGDNVVTTDISYPGDTYLWLNKKADGVALRFAKTDRGYISAEALMSYADENTRVVCLTIVENKFGFRHDVETIGRLCHEKGILFAVDATQGANVLNIDIKRMHIDFLAASGYKWLMCPVGVGVACIGEELLSKLSQSQVGWVGTEDRRRNDCQVLNLSPDAKRFEYGGLNFLGYYALDEVVERNLKLGGPNIEAYVMSMVDTVYERAKAELRHIRLYNDFPKKNRAQVITFVIPPEWHMDTLDFQQMGLRCRVFDGELLRVGFHYCNIPADIDKLMAVLRELEERAASKQ